MRIAWTVSRTRDIVGKACWLQLVSGCSVTMPEWCVANLRRVTSSRSPTGVAAEVNSGTCSINESLNVSMDASAIIINAVAVKGFVLDAIRNLLRSSGARPLPVSVSPNP